MLALLILTKLFEPQEKTMSKFSYLEKTKPVLETPIAYTLEQITINGKHPILKVVFAGEGNRKYFNALLQHSQLTNKGVRTRKKNNINVDTLKEVRNRDREMYPKYIVTGWENVMDNSGKNVEFSEEECKDFLSSLPDWIFDELRDFCTNELSFTDSLDIEVIAKKS